jgi:hypothetical protein
MWSSATPTATDDATAAPVERFPADKLRRGQNRVADCAPVTSDGRIVDRTRRSGWRFHDSLESVVPPNAARVESPDAAAVEAAVAQNFDSSGRGFLAAMA